jgi:hypothetical protein
MVNSIIQSLSIVEAADKAIAELVTRRVVNGRVIIAMPVAACTGSLVSVSISEVSGGEFMVSDDGCAFREISDNLYSTRTFANTARKSAERYGARFDGYSMLLLKVGASGLKMAIIAMASLAKEVIDITVAKDSVAKASTERDMMRERIDLAFGSAQVTEEAEILGYSTQPYRFDLMVKDDRGTALFEFFSGQGVSINSAFAKFSDVHQTEGSPRIGGVTTDLNSIGPKLILLNSVTDRLLEVNDASDRYDLLAA